MVPIPALLLAFASFFSDDSFPSGPQVGDKLVEFSAQAFSGPDAGKEFKVIAKTKGAPTLLIFVHQITRPGLQCLRPIDKYAGENARLASHIVWLSGDKDKTEAYLKRAEKSLNLQAPISISRDGKDGPPAYGLNDRVALTVLIAKDNQVVANFALVDPNARDSARVIAAVARALGKTPPK